jgi:acyl carrier protein
MNVKDIVNDVVHEVLKKHGIRKETITAEKLVIDDLQAESLDIIEMMLEFQDQFHVSISEEDISGIQTIGDIYEFISSRLAAVRK